MVLKNGIIEIRLAVMRKMRHFDAGPVPLLLSDVQRPELPLTLGQKDVHGPVQQMDAELSFPLQRPVGHHAVKISSLLIGEHL